MYKLHAFLLVRSFVNYAHLVDLQNAAAIRVLGLHRPTHVTPTVQQLHWLPNQICIVFKTTTLMYRVIKNGTLFVRLNFITY